MLLKLHSNFISEGTIFKKILLRPSRLAGLFFPQLPIDVVWLSWHLMCPCISSFWSEKECSNSTPLPLFKTLDLPSGFGELFYHYSRLLSHTFKTSNIEVQILSWVQMIVTETRGGSRILLRGGAHRQKREPHSV